MINGYFSSFKGIEGHIFGSRSCQGQTNSQNMSPVLNHNYAKYKKDKSNNY